MESFEGLNAKMFEPRGTIISFASKDYTWEEFLKPSRYSYKKIKLGLILNEFGFIDVYYSEEYKEKIESIIEKYNSKISSKQNKNVFRKIIDYVRFNWKKQINVANYFGRFYQDNGLLKTYNWDITYKEYIFWWF